MKVTEKKDVKEVVQEPLIAKGWAINLVGKLAVKRTA